MLGIRIDEGWQFIAVASELRFMLNAIDDIIQKLGLGKQKAEMAKYRQNAAACLIP